MYSVANLFFRGIYHVTDPFHPFGGAVDIIVVEQPDGSFKSSPWYVRFGKFQGVLKTNENAVNISVNGVEAKFHMYLDYKGEAYFLTEETDEQSRNESSSQSKGGNLDGNDTSSSDQIHHNDKGVDDKVVIGTNSRPGILGLVFGRKLVKKDNGIEEGNVERVDEVEQAEIAAELMEMKWSTNLPTDEVTHHPDSNSSNTHENDLHISETLEGLEDTEIEEGNDVERVDSLEQAEIAAELMEMKWSTNLPTDEVTKMDSLSGSLVLDLENNPKLDEIEVNPKSDSVIKHALKENKDDGMCEGEIRKERVSSYLYCETPKSLPLVDGNLGNVVIETPRLTRAGLEEVQVPSRVDYETKAHFFEVNSRSESIEIAINGNVHDVGLLSYESSGKISTTDVIDYNVKNDIIESHSSLVDRHIVTSNILEAANFEALQLELVTEGMPDENKLEAEYSVWPHGSNIDDLTSPVLLDELISKSSPLSIPIVRQGRSEEIEWRMASLPNFRSHIDDLESAEVFHPLSCSVDSGSKRLEIFKSDTPVSIEHDLESNSAFLDIQHTALHTSSPKDIQRMSSISGIAFPITSGMPSFAHDQSHQPEDMFVGDQVYATLEGQSPRSIVIASGRSWRWPFSFTRSGTIGSVRPELSSSTDSGAGKASEGISYLLTDESGQELKVSEKKVSFVPTSEELASLNLKEGKNMVTFTYSTVMLRKQQVHARIFLWKWDARIVISDVDGTITKSDVLGQFMPLVGKDWSQTGVAHLFSAIEQNGYQFLFLSARSVSQAYLTRQFIINLKQDGKTLPDGPVVISPDGLFPSLFREVIRRAPHEFKIACLEKIKELFPPDCQPFYAGFGNRLTDEISYLKVGISRGKIFTINPRGEIAVHHRVDTESYTSLHALVNGMFPAMSAGKEEFGSWQYWRIPLPDLDI